jgi:NADH-quinone oxidoreductase subunit M
MTLFPEGLHPWGVSFFGLGSWRDVLSLLAVIGILYGAMVALVQSDLKFVVGYSSVSHMGFVLLGLMTLNSTGLSGAVLQMFSHGIIAGLLFAVVGRMLYDRTHTRQLAELEAMNLARHLPFAAVTFVLAAVASMGLPGFSGFVAELQVLIGAWQAFPGFAILAGAGVVISVAYSLRALQRSFFAESQNAGKTRLHDEGRGMFDRISVPEKIGAILLLSVSLFVGLYPDCLLRLIGPSLTLPMFDWLGKGGAL